MEKITSRENAKVKYACRLASSGAFRRAEGRFLAEGRKLCPELCRGAELETLFCTESALEKCPELSELPGEHYLVEDHVADKLADVGTHQGVFGVFRTPVHTLEEVKPGGRYLALERVQDPGNVGTLLRSAAAFGFDGVLLSDGCASVFAPKTLRASMGAAVRIPVIEAGKMPEAIALLREKGITCLAAALYQSQPLSAAASSYPDGVCVVIGSEGQGLTDETIAACTGTVRIPMTDRVESLNAGIAGAKHVLGVDASELAVAQAQKNAALNHLSDTVEFKCADVFDLLPALENEGKQFDVVILDPPAFTKSKNAIKNAVKGYREINLRGMKLVKDGGYLATCSCSHYMNAELFAQTIGQAARAAHCRLRQVEFRTQSPDHPILWSADESYYLKFYIFQVCHEH